MVRDLICFQTGLRIQDWVRVGSSNIKPVTFSEPSLFVLVLGREGSSWDEMGIWRYNLVSNSILYSHSSPNSANRDFKQRQRGRRRERHRIRENPKGPLLRHDWRGTGWRSAFRPDLSGAQFALSENVSFRFRFLSVLPLNNPLLLISRNFNCLFSYLREIFHFKESKGRESWSELKPVRRTCEYREIYFWKLM